MAKRMTVRRVAEMIDQMLSLGVEAPDIDGHLAIKGCSRNVRIKAWQFLDERDEAEAEERRLERRRAGLEAMMEAEATRDENLEALWSGH